MALILGIETATSICSVALVLNEKVIALRETVGTQQHSAILTEFISEVFRETGLTYSQLDVIAVSIGPGSYTGLRIGVSSAKGLCYALDKPLIAIDTLKALTLQAVAWCKLQNIEISNVLFAPMIDARRMEVYTAIYDNNLEPVETLKAIVVNEESFKEYKGKQIFYFGDGASKCTSLFDHNNKLTFLQNIQLSAEAIGKLAEVDFASNTFADVVYCEPFYLKEFIAGKPRVKGLTD